MGYDESLLSFNNSLEANKLIITTHSPYLINGFTIAVKTAIVKKLIQDKQELLDQLNVIYPIDSIIDPDDLIIYELDEGTGSVKILESYRGLPSDDNFLNMMLEESNNMFAQLLQIQQGYE